MGSTVKYHRNDPSRAHPEFDRLFHAYYAPLVFFAARLVRNRQVAEDIAADAFAHLWERFTDFPGEARTRSFLYTTAKNACLNVMKRGEHRAQLPRKCNTSPEHSHDCIIERMVQTELYRQLWSIVDTLPEECGKIVRLKYRGGLTREQIARQLQISGHTVRNQLARGLSLIRKQLRNNV